MARVDDVQYAFGQTEWSNYQKYRPAYPDSLIKLIKDYHVQHCGRFDLAHDVGSGSGVFVPTLVDDLGFTHVHVSDATADNMAAAQRNLSAWATRRHSADTDTKRDHATLTLSQTIGEELNTCTIDGSVDMITVMEAAHWMDGDRMMAAAHQALTQSGTLAMVVYAGRVHIKNNERADTALGEVFGRLWKTILSSKWSDNAAGRARIEHGAAQGSVGLDFILLDPKRWATTRRIRIRSGDKGRWPHNNNCLDDDSQYAESRVRVDEVMEYCEDGDTLADGWEKAVRKDWFAGYLCSFDNVMEGLFDSEEYRALLRVLNEDYPGYEDEIVIEWVVDIVLASKG